MSTSIKEAKSLHQKLLDHVTANRVKTAEYISKLQETSYTGHQIQVKSDCEYSASRAQELLIMTDAEC